MPECTCRGGNPNCFKSGGWGWIGDGISEGRAIDCGSLSPVKPVVKRKIKPVKRKSKSRIRNVLCPYCKRKVGSLDHHVSVYHPEEWSQYAEKYIIKSRILSKNLRRCEKCGALVKKIDKHLLKVHGVKSELGDP